MHEEVGDLFGHPFLHLRAMRQGLDHAGELAQSEHASIRQIADVRVPHEGEQMVFADTVEGDVTHQHDLVVLFRERLAEVHLRIGVQSAEHFGVHAGHASRRFQQALAIWILADGQQDLADGPFDTGMVDGPVAGLTVAIWGIGFARWGSGVHAPNSTTAFNSS